MQTAWAISNLVALLLIAIALWRPFAARITLSLIFIGAAIVNAITAIQSPEAYLVYAEMGALPVYKRFILGYFSRNTELLVLVIASLQLLVGICMFSRGFLGKIAVYGATFFLLAIAPLGMGSAFPCSLLLAAASIIQVYKR